MTPLKLSISGLYSYKTPQTIDFTKLTQTKLFGIFGNVGSGKSSILEAITYALYGETERLSKQDMRGYNMMNLQSNEMSIDFEFFNKTSDDKYKFTVQAKRSKTDNTVIRTPKRIAYKLVNNEWKALESANADEIIGINYQNFKRTVIIPQGRFMEFLQLKPAERTKMLKELFNLHKYELFPQTVKLESENNAILNNLQGAIDQIGEIDSLEIEHLQAEIKKTEEHKEKGEIELSKVESEFQIQDKLKVLNERRNSLLTEKEKLSAKEETIILKEKLVSEYEFCDKTFRHRISEIDNLLLKSTNLKKHRDSLESSIFKNKSTIKTLNSQIESLQKKANLFDLEKDKIQDLQAIILIQELEAKEAFQANRLENGEIETEKLKSEIERISQIIKEQKLQLKELPSIRNDINMSLNNKAVLLEYQALDKAVQSKKNSILALEKEIAEKSTSAISLANDYKLTKESNESDFELLIKQNKAILDKKESEYENELISHSAVDISAQLQEGKPCPVCGSIEHPHIATESDFSLKKQAYLAEIKELRLYIEKLQHTKNAWLQLQSDIDEKRSQRSVLDKELHTETIERNEVLGKISGPVLPLNTIEKTISKLQVREKELIDIENSNNKHQDKLEIHRSTQQKYSDGIQNIKNDILIIQTELKSLQNGIKQLDVSAYKTKSKEALQAIIDEINKSIITTESELNIATDKKQSTKNLISNDRGQLSSITKQLEILIEELSKKQNESSILISESKYENIDSIKTILSQNINIEEEQKLINEFRTELISVSERLAELNNQFSSITYDEDLYKSLLGKKNQLKEETTRLVSLLTTQKVKYDDVLRKQKTLKDLVKQYKAKLVRAENLKTIRELFKGAGFVNFASTVYLDNLCNLANERFYSLTQQKLKLELASDNSFWVRDYLNNGELRSVKTLSGGQSFQAALSLALALSDSIQLHNNYSQNFFFLDEGFGSQDSESLAMIFDTFSALRAENKIVGIISHVESLKENIGSYIEVKNTDDLGSIIL